MTVISDSTPLTDRQVLIHVLEHVEDLHAKIDELMTALEPFRPMLEKLQPGSGDLVSIMKARRELKRLGRP